MVALAALIALVLLFSPAMAREEIILFDSTVEVRPDGDLVVTERIRVRAEGASIKRGIYRDFPLRFKYDDGSYGKVGFRVIEVLRDGAPEPWFRKDMNGHARIYIGRKDVFIPRGEHVYAITYRTSRQLRYFADYDELYWNVTGNFWLFPIRKAKVTVRLPASARPLRHALYTGAHGTRGQARAAVVKVSPGLFVAETTAPLPPRNGFTVAIAFPKGVVAEPSAMEKRLRRFLDNLGFWWLLAGSLVSAGYFLWAWNRVGRDPAPGAIFPRWQPPLGLSPAATGWLHGEASLTGHDSTRAFIAALVSLATRGVIRIGEEGGKKTLTRLRQAPAGLPPGEAAIMDKLFSAGRRKITISRDDHEYIAAARKAFSAALAGEYEEVFVRRNRLWFFIGLALAAVTIIGFLALSARGGDALAAFMGPLMFIAIPGVILWQFLARWRAMGAMQKILAVPMLLIPVLFMGIGIATMFTGFGDFALRGDYPVIMALVLLPLLVVVFWFLMPRLTEEGRRALDAVEGLKMFIETAEEPRLNMPSAPPMSISTFEKLLPYAIALGVEEPWTRAFGKWLATATAAGAAAYHPNWYGGRDFSPRDLSRMGSDLVGGISRDMAAAVPVRTSSGSGGGGFSGGGGGGGGGGGW